MCYCYSVKHQLLYCSLKLQCRKKELPATVLTLQLLISTSCCLSYFRQLVIFTSCEDCFVKVKSDLNPNSHVDTYCGSYLYRTDRLTCFLCEMFSADSVKDGGGGGLIIQRCIVELCVLVYREL